MTERVLTRSRDPQAVQGAIRSAVDAFIERCRRRVLQAESQRSLVQLHAQERAVLDALPRD